MNALTRRQYSIMARVADGWTSAEIGKHLGITGKTVDWHCLNVCAKLGVKGRWKAVAELKSRGLIPK